MARDVLRDHWRLKEREAPLSFDEEPTIDPIRPPIALERLRELAEGDPLVSLLLDRETGDDDGAGFVWRALDVSPRELHNARRRLKRMVRRLTSEADDAP